ncbi:MAG: hypothetical protein ACPHLK_09520 [Gammaproteobacteria bacterium]
MPTRLYQTFDDLHLFLKKHDTIDLFDLLIEFNISNDEIPAQNMAALMAALDADVLIELEQHDIMNAASFIRDTMKYDVVRWSLKEDKKERETKKDKS